MPIKIAIIGKKNTGKTTMMRSLIRELRAKDYKVMAAKHVDCEDFTMDQEDTDTWWHSKEGADPVVCVSDIETAIIHSSGISRFEIDGILAMSARPIDILLLEGFTQKVIGDRDVAKVIIVKDMDELQMYKRDAAGPHVWFFRAHGIKEGNGWGDGRNDVVTDPNDIVKNVMDLVGGTHGPEGGHP